MTTIGLIRHGVTEWNNLGKAQGMSDIPLNKLGKIQARKIGARLLNDENWDIIISSDLSRAVETAEVIGDILNIPFINRDKRIREMDCGDIEGTTELIRRKRWGNNWRKLDLGMESFDKVGNRGIKFLEDITDLHIGKRVLIVSHGALIGLTLQQLLPELFKSTHIDNTSLTILNHNNENWNCALYNCTKHLIDV